MTGEWRDTTLGDVLMLQRGFDLPEIERKPGTHPVIASTGPVGTHDTAMVQGPGVVIGRSGSLGGGQFIEGDFWPLNTTLWVKDFKGNDRRFCYYLLKSLDLAQFNAGSGVPTLNRNHIHPFSVSVPANTIEQRAIAHILGTMDDKIDLNRRMNETLEAMARELFKSWFVNFDPVHAKVEGHAPCLPKHIANLFPTSFEDSELGKIPSGWMARPLYDTASYVNGAAFKNIDFCNSDEGLPVIKIAELKDGITAQTKYSRRATDDAQRVDTGDLLYSWSGSPDTSLDAFLWTNGPGLLNQHIFKVVASSAAQKRFVYYLLKHLRSVLVETARNKQTTGLGHVTVADMKRLQVCWPSPSVLFAFDHMVAPFFDRAFLNMLECSALVALRDTLLPKLISGELRVPGTD